MTLRFPTVILIVLCAGSVSGQPGSTLTGQVQGWEDLEADLRIVHPHLPPSPPVGAVASDGSFTVTIPPVSQEEGFLSVAEFALPPNCEGTVVTPEDARFKPIAFGVFDEDGDVVGELLQVNPGNTFAIGPEPGGFSVLSGFARERFSVRATCPDPDRRVTEEFDLTVDEAGWFDVVQRFAEDPTQPGWRIDTWAVEPVPEDTTWIMLPR